MGNIFYDKVLITIGINLYIVLILGYTFESL